MQDARSRPIHYYLLLVGIPLALIGIAGLIYATYPLGTRQGASYVGGPGDLLQIDFPESLREADSDIVRVRYEFSRPVDYDSSGQAVNPVVYEDITVTLQAPSFNTAPPSGQPIAKHVRNEVPYEWTWVVGPKQVGQHQIALEFIGVSGPTLAEVASDLEVDQLPENSTTMSTLDWPLEKIREQSDDPEYTLSLVLPIAVVDVFGLTAVQARIVSGIPAILGSGFTLTGLLAFLYSRYQKQRPRSKKRRQSSKRKRRKR